MKRTPSATNGAAGGCAHCHYPLIVIRRDFREDWHKLFNLIQKFDLIIITTILCLVIAFAQLLSFGIPYATIITTIVSLTAIFIIFNRNMEGSAGERGEIYTCLLTLTLGLTVGMTTPGVIIAWAFSLREGYIFWELVVEALMLAGLVFTTVLLGVMAARAKNAFHKLGEKINSGKSFRQKVRDGDIVSEVPRPK